MDLKVVASIYYVEINFIHNIVINMFLRAYNLQIKYCKKLFHLSLIVLIVYNNNEKMEKLLVIFFLLK